MKFLPISFENLDSRVTAITITEDNKVIAAAFEYGTIRLFDVKNGICLNNIQTSDCIWDEDNFIKSIFITKDQKSIITVSDKDQIRIWNLSTKECVKTIKMTRHINRFPNSFSFNSDANLFFIGAGGLFRQGKLLVLNATTGDILLEDKEICPIRCLCTSCGARPLNTNIIVLGFTDGKVKILNQETNKDLTFSAGLVTSVDLSSDNKVVATASTDNTIKLWNTKTGECINKFEGDSVEICEEILSTIPETFRPSLNSRE